MTTAAGAATVETATTVQFAARAVEATGTIGSEPTARPGHAGSRMETPTF